MTSVPRVDINKVSSVIVAVLLPIVMSGTVRAQTSGSGRQDSVVRAATAFGPKLPVPVEPFSSRRITYEDLRGFGVESNENWDAAQDASGRIFVANGRGVLVFDGETWTTVTTPRTTAVRSLEIGPGNRIFVGAQGEFGYLVPDSTSFRFESLSELVREEDKSFGDVWATRADDRNVYFQARNHLFVWDGTNLTTHYSKASFHTAFMTDQGLILRERGVGLVRYSEGATALIPGGEFFAEMRVFVLKPQGTGWFVGTRDHGFFTMSGNQITPFATQADSLLTEYWLYTSAESPGGELILGTLGAGLIGMDSEGRVTSRVTSQTGLPDDAITSITPIRPHGFLATTQNNGLYLFEPAGVTSKWGERSLQAASQVLIEDETLYLSTGQGLYSTRLDVVGAPTDTLRDTNTYATRFSKGYLYIATDEGLEISRDGAWVATVLADEQVMAIEAYENGVVAGSRSGLAIVSGAAVSYDFPADDVQRIAVAGDDIWFSTVATGLHRLRRNGAEWKNDTFGKNEGLPADDRLEVVTVDGSVRAYADDSEGVFKLAAGWFVRDVDLTPLGRPGETEIWDLEEGPDGVVWIGYPDRVEMAVPSGSGYVLTRPPALDRPRPRHEELYPHLDGTLWFNRDGYIVRYNPAVDRDHRTGFETILREVRTRRDGGLVYGGSMLDESGSVGNDFADQVQGVLPFAQNTVQFQFSSAYPGPAASVNYSWRLTPGREAWSAWSAETEAAFEDLYEGGYAFEVKARDDHQKESKIVAFRFDVLPPWYRTWTAYIAYLLGFGSLIWFAYQYQVMAKAQKTAALQARELEREKIYRRKLEGANTRLLQANKLKDEFLAKTSHELRTPITAILGFTNILKEEIPKDVAYREFLDIIQQSGDRLMGTLDDLLELATLRSGTREIRTEPTELSPLLNSVVSPLRQKAAEKGLYLRVRGASEVAVDVDQTALFKILWNLVDNAIKFTESGGLVLSVSVLDACACTGGAMAGGCIKIEVADSGIGIDERFIPHLFDEFVQESDGESRSHTGTGLGLTIVGGLIELVGGEIDVKSEKGVGSTFVVQMPVEAVHDRAVRSERAEQVPGKADERAGRESVHASSKADRPAKRRDRDDPTPGRTEPA
jgi:signal transduction histidine kinase